MADLFFCEQRVPPELLPFETALDGQNGWRGHATWGWLDGYLAGLSRVAFEALGRTWRDQLQLALLASEYGQLSALDCAYLAALDRVLIAHAKVAQANTHRPLPASVPFARDER